VADGRHFLLTNDERYDVLTFEPPPPSDAGIVNLYSREFYEIAKQRLSEGGVVAQWMPLDIPRPQVPRMMIRTMLDTFDHVSLWIPNRMEGIAIGSSEPLKIDVEILRERMQEPAIQHDLDAIGFDSPESILATFIAADEDLARWVGDVPDVTDDRPRIEYYNFYPRGTMTFDDVLSARQDITKCAVNVDEAVLNREREVMVTIWREHEARFSHNLKERENAIRTGINLAPDNKYLKYLQRVFQQEQSGLNKEQDGTRAHPG